MKLEILFDNYIVVTYRRGRHRGGDLNPYIQSASYVLLALVKVKPAMTNVYPNKYERYFRPGRHALAYYTICVR